MSVRGSEIESHAEGAMANRDFQVARAFDATWAPTLPASSVGLGPVAAPDGAQ